MQTEAVLTEVKAINSVLKGGDKNALYGHSVDDLFTSHGDVWGYIKKYVEDYGDIPSFDVVKDKFDFLPDVEVNGKTKYYFDTLRREYIDHRVETLLLRAGEAHKKGTPPAEIKRKLQDALAKLDRFESTARTLKITDFDNAQRRYDSVRERAIAMGGTPGIQTGIEFIDACMPLGMQAGDVMSIIGYPGRGKSALGTLFAAKAIARGHKPLIFTREMTAEAVQDRIFTVMGSGLFSNTELMLGYYNEDELRQFAKKYEGTEGWIEDGNGTGDMTPNFMRTKVEQYRPDFILLDYLQLFQDNRLSNEMTPRMMNLSLEIKNLANQLAIPTVVISSATPPDGGKVDGPPNVERSAWSRQLSYDSSVSFAVHRLDGSNWYQIECAKNRYGPLFSGYLEWDMDRGTYEERLELG